MEDGRRGLGPAAGEARPDQGCGPHGAASSSLFSWVRINGRNLPANAMNASSANTASQCRRGPRGLFVLPDVKAVLAELASG